MGECSAADGDRTASPVEVPVIGSFVMIGALAGLRLRLRHQPDSPRCTVPPPPRCPVPTVPEFRGHTGPRADRDEE